jgi:hypothetical protein
MRTLLTAVSCLMLYGLAIATPLSMLDLSGCSDDQITEVAQQDAQVYVQVNPKLSLDDLELSSLALRKAFQHNLLGDKAETYKVDFFFAYKALKSTAPGP